MKNYDPTARYLEADYWIRKEEDGIYTVGVTDFAQTFFPNLIAIHDLPLSGNEYAKGDLLALVESDKVTTELTFPVRGKVIEVNKYLKVAPALLNESPFKNGWILKMKSVDLTDWNSLQSAENYLDFIGTFFRKE